MSPVWGPVKVPQPQKYKIAGNWLAPSYDERLQVEAARQDPARFAELYEASKVFSAALRS